MDEPETISVILLIFLTFEKTVHRCYLLFYYAWNSVNLINSYYSLILKNEKF